MFGAEARPMSEGASVRRPAHGARGRGGRKCADLGRSNQGDREDGAMRKVAWAAALLFAACYPGGAETVQDLDSVTTRHDASASFSTLRTYALPDSIQEVASSRGQPLPIDHSYDAQILARVAANLDAIGLHRVNPTAATPDVDVLVTFTATRYIEYTSYSFCNLWPGWGGFTG